MLPKRAIPSPSPSPSPSDNDPIFASLTLPFTQNSSNVDSSPTPTTSPFTIYGGDSSSSNDSGNSDTDNNLVNMYFLILAAFVILLLFGLWYWRRGRRLKRIASLGRRRDALEQDLELGREGGERSAWLGNTPGIRGGVRREEGVDERGEAPPPYSAATTTEVGTPGVDLTVPPGAHVRNGGPVLPKYEELGREERLARTPEGELVVVDEERELLRESSSSGTEDMGARVDELAPEPIVIPNPRAEEADGGGGARHPSDAGTLETTAGEETLRDVAPGGSATGADRA